MPHIEFWFDLISPYAFFGWLQVRDLAARHEATLRCRPVLFGALLDHHGQLGPAEVPAKRAHLFRDIARYAGRHGIELRGPAAHPFHPVTALRLCLPEVAGERQHDVIDALFRGGWSHGADLGDPKALEQLLDEAGLDGEAWLLRTAAPEVKAALRSEVEAAIAGGVFGVPTFVVDGELFWGNDQVPHVDAYLEGRDPLPDGVVERLLAMPTGVVRRRS